MVKSEIATFLKDKRETVWIVRFLDGSLVSMSGTYEEVSRKAECMKKARGGSYVIG